jgi:hypothetical protein
VKVGGVRCFSCGGGGFIFKFDAAIDLVILAAFERVIRGIAALLQQAAAYHHWPLGAIAAQEQTSKFKLQNFNDQTSTTKFIISYIISYIIS